MNKRKIFNYFLIFYFFITITFFSILFIIFINTDLIQNKKNNYINKIFNSGRFEYIYLPKIIYLSVISNFKKIEQIYINLNFEDQIILEDSRNQAIKDFGNNTFDPNIFVETDVNINHNNSNAKGTIRLKGDRDIHWKNKDNSSYKVNLSNDNFILNMNKFSLQKPRARNYIHEWIYLKFAKNENIISIDYEFINLNINGESFGLYVLEEGFNKDLLEKNGRRNGPIFSLNETFSTNPEEAIFKIYNEQYWLKEENIKVFKTAKQNLENFFNGNTKAKDVFDLKKWASFFAITDITHTYHGLYAKSVKFYFNPVSNLFEPIPFDGHRKKPNYSKFSPNYDNRILLDIITEPKNDGLEFENFFLWIKKFFFSEDNSLNQEFYSMYLQELKRISSVSYLDNFFKKNKKKIDFINSKIYGDYFLYDNVFSYGPGIYYFNQKDFYFRSEIINKKLINSGLILAIEDNNKNQIIISNNFPKHHFSPEKKYGELYISHIVCNSILNQQDTYYKVNQKINYFKKVKIDTNSNNLKNCEYIIAKDENYNSQSIKINKLNKIYNKKNLKYSKKNSFEYENNYKNYFYIKEKNLFLKDKTILIDESLILPENFTLNIRPGEKIKLINNSFIISKANIISICKKENPCEISGNKDNFGGGILFLNNKQKNILEYINFSYLSGLKTDFEYNGKLFSEKTKHIYKNKYASEMQVNIPQNSEFKSFILYGAINFNQTSIEMKNVKFHSIYSEDALNIINSKFNLKNVYFDNVYSDAIDIDTGVGTFEYLSFSNIYNDALDFSNSNIKGGVLKFNNIGDKMISVGENSRVNLNNINGIKSSVGIASKDGSFTSIENINLKNVKIPFASYQKKKLYDIGNLTIKNYSSKDNLVEYLKDRNSNLVINNHSMKEIQNFPLEIIYKKRYELLKNI